MRLFSVVFPVSLLLVALAATVFFAVATAQENETPSPNMADLQRKPAEAIDARTSPTAQPVPVPEPSPLALQYYRSGNVLWFLWQIIDLAVPAIVLFSGWSPRLRNAAQKIGRKWFFVIGIYFLLYSVIAYLFEFPLSVYGGYFRQHAYGLSNQTFARWFENSLKTLAVDIAFGAAFLWIPYWLVRRSPRRWWLYTGLCSIPVVIFCVLIQPIWIDPLFNQFGPMKDKALETRILALAERAGIEDGRVFEVDKSVDTKAMNAYVTGFGGSKRIVLWDTLLKKLDANEIEFIMAHEMAHYVLHHIVIGIFAAGLAILIGLYAVHRLAGFCLRHASARFGFQDLPDIASFPLMLGLFRLVSFVMIPIALAFSRYEEHAADRFALDLTHDNHAAATAFARLSSENLGNPRPGMLYILFRASHPSIGSRIDFANTYHPWEQAQP